MKKLLVAFIVCVALLLPIAIYAEDGKPKGVLDYSLGQYGATLAVALLGGLVSWYNKVRKGEIPSWGIFHLVGELLTSALAGLLCFWLCEWLRTPQLLTIAMVGISGHMGTRAIGLMETYAAKRAGVDLQPRTTESQHGDLPPKG